MKNELTAEDRARGRKRQAELAAELKIAVQVNSASLLASLGRSPTEPERMQAEMLASLFLRARRVREGGGNDTSLLRQAAQLMRDTPFLRSPHAAPATEPRAKR